MKTAFFDKGLKTLTYFDYKNTTITINCSSIEQAKKTIHISEVEHNTICISNMCKKLRTINL